MKIFSRRDFLHLIALSAGSLALDQFLTACGIKPTPSLPTQTPVLATCLIRPVFGGIR